MHRLRSLRPHDVIVVRGVVTETALRAIWTEAGRYASPARRDLGTERVGRLLDRAHTAGLVTWAGLHEMVEDLQQRGRAGTVIMRALAEQRPSGSSPIESRNEAQFERVLIEGHRRLFRRQEVLGGHEPIGRCDFADQDLPLAFEVNSMTFHTAPTDRAADEQRYQALMNAGFTVGVAWDEDLWANPRAVLQTVDAARAHARRHRRVVIHSPACPWPHPRVGAPLPH